MSSPPPPDPPRPSGPTRHRASTPLPEVVRRLAPPLVAVVAVATVILLLLVLNSRPSGSGPAPGAVAEAPSSTAASHTAPADSVTTSPTVTPTTAPTPAPPVSEPRATQAPAVARLPVTVLNNSRRTGLAAHVAAQVRAQGWPVRRTGNFTGRIPETTVYYDAGQRASAEALARALPQIRRVEPRFRGLPGTGLTLVVTRDWSS